MKSWTQIERDERYSHNVGMFHLERNHFVKIHFYFIYTHP